MKKKNLQCHVKKGDFVKIISGEKKGFVGKISLINFKKVSAFLEGLPPRIKREKKTENGETQRKSIPLAIHLSNLMLWDTQKNIASRIGHKIINEKKYRYFKKSGNIF